MHGATIKIRRKGLGEHVNTWEILKTHTDILVDVLEEKESTWHAENVQKFDAGNLNYIHIALVYSLWAALRAGQCNEQLNVYYIVQKYCGVQSLGIFKSRSANQCLPAMSPNVESHKEKSLI